MSDVSHAAVTEEQPWLLDPGFVAGRRQYRLRASYDEWLRLPDLPRSEWVDGEAVLSPPASYRHMRASRRIANLLEQSLAGLEAVQETGVALPGNIERVPDVTVVDRPPEQRRIERTPVLVVEILSPSTRIEDTVVKSAEYAAAGIGQFWVVDPEHRTIDVHELHDGGWRLLAHLDDGQPTATVVVGDHGGAALDLSVILAD